MAVCEQLLLVGVEPLGGLAVDGGVVDYGNGGVLQQIAAEMLDPALLILRLFIMGLVAGVNDQPAAQLPPFVLVDIGPTVAVAVGNAVADDQDALDLAGAQSGGKTGPSTRGGVCSLDAVKLSS
mgnify:CR=1 FL=1